MKIIRVAGWHPRHTMTIWIQNMSSTKHHKNKEPSSFKINNMLLKFLRKSRVTKFTPNHGPHCYHLHHQHLWMQIAKQCSETLMGSKPKEAPVNRTKQLRWIPLIHSTMYHILSAILSNTGHCQCHYCNHHKPNSYPSFISHENTMCIIIEQLQYQIIQNQAH